MKIAVIGATGLVGREILKVLESKSISISKFFAVASEKSVGKTIHFAVYRLNGRLNLKKPEQL